MTRPLFLALCLLATPAHADTLSGAATVHDGDTLRLGDTRIRLWGIDAPELGQECQRPGGKYACGIEARDALAKYVDGWEVVCEPRGKSYERVVAVCSIGGVDIATWMVGHGWAVDWKDYSGGAYRGQQHIADIRDLGIWAGPFVLEKSGVSGE
jgi:endonuclease YncB( thermonuclease family)